MTSTFLGRIRLPEAGVSALLLGDVSVTRWSGTALSQQALPVWFRLIKETHCQKKPKLH